MCRRKRFRGHEQRVAVLMTRKAALRLTLALAGAVLFSMPAQAGAARTISIDDAQQAEPPGGGSEPMAFKVKLSKAHPDNAVKAEYDTSPGTAGALDFAADSGTIKIPAGKTKTTIEIPVRGDLFAEPDEVFSLELLRPKRAKIGDGEAEGLIPANDNGPDADGDDIPDADDCAPNDPNPEGALECFVPTTIYDLNAGELPTGTRAYLENVLITARAGNNRVAYGATIPGDPGYSGQDFSGIELRTADIFLETGSRQFLSGSVRDGFFQVTDTGDSAPCCEAVPDPIAVTPASLASGPDALNGLLVEITNVSVASSSAEEWLLTESIRVDDDLFSELPQFGPGTVFESVRGHATTAGGGTPAISPRGLNDIDPTVAMLLDFVTNDSCLGPNQQDVVIGDVFIDEPQASDTVISLEAVDDGVLNLPTTVTVPAGETQAQVIADAATGENSFTEVEATFGPITHSIFVEIWEGC